MNQAYICSAVRTPIGSFGGMFASIPATELGSIAIRGAIERANLDPSLVQEVLMGNVVSANLGQAPARQASIGAGLSNRIPCTTINKVCSSGVKAIAMAAQSIMLGHNDIVVAGGMENMSAIPFYLEKARWGYKFGNNALIDGLQRDGLEDVYDRVAMGTFADATAEKYHFSREDQDAYAINSYKRAAESTESGKLGKEIIPVSVPQRRGDPLIITEDEEFKKVKFEKISNLRPAFSKDGTVTAANASTINDGAAAVILASAEAVKQHGLTPIARIVSFADAAHEPQWFTTAPTKAAPLALDRAGLKISDVDYTEVNEAFSVVAMAFNKVMDIDPSTSNVYGGAVSLGHPLGASGTRIVTTLCNVLSTENGKYGLAAICNGGGGASAMVIESL